MVDVVPTFIMKVVVLIVIFILIWRWTWASPLPCCQDNCTKTVEDDSDHDCKNNSHHHNNEPSRAKRHFDNFTNSMKKAAISVGRTLHIVNKREGSLPEKQLENHTILEGENTRNSTVKRQINIENKTDDIQNTTTTVTETQSNTTIKRHYLDKPIVKRQIADVSDNVQKTENMTLANERVVDSNNDSLETQNSTKLRRQIPDSKSITHLEKNSTKIGRYVFGDRAITKRQKPGDKNDTSSSDDKSTPTNTNKTLLETARNMNTKTKREVAEMKSNFPKSSDNIDEANNKTSGQDRISAKTRRDIFSNKTTAEELDINNRTSRDISKNESIVDQEQINNRNRRYISEYVTTTEEEKGNNRTAEEENLSNKTRREVYKNEVIIERDQLRNKTTEEEKLSNKTRREVSGNVTTAEEEKGNNKTAEEESLSNKTRREVYKNEVIIERDQLRNKTTEEEKLSNKTRREVYKNEIIIEKDKLINKSRRDVSGNVTTAEEEKGNNKTAEEEKLSNKTRRDVYKNEVLIERDQLRNKTTEKEKLSNKTRRELYKNEIIIEKDKLINKTRRDVSENVTTAEEEKGNNKTAEEEKLSNKTRREVYKNEVLIEREKLREKTRRDISGNETTAEQVVLNNKTRRHVFKNQSAAEQEKVNEKTKREIFNNGTSEEQENVNTKARRDSSHNITTAEQEIASNRTRRDISKNETTVDQEKRDNKTKREISKNETIAEQDKVSDRSRRDIYNNETTADQEKIDNKTKREIYKNETSAEQEKVSERSRRDIYKNETTADQEKIDNKTKNGTIADQEKVQNKTKREEEKVSDIAKINISKNETTVETEEVINKTKREISKNETISEKVENGNITRRDISKNETTVEQEQEFNKTKRENSNNGTQAEQEKVNNQTRRDVSKNETFAEQGQITNKTRRHIDNEYINNRVRRNIHENETTAEQGKLNNKTRRDTSENRTIAAPEEVSNKVIREISKNGTSVEQAKVNNDTKRDIFNNETTAVSEKVNNETKRDISKNEPDEINNKTRRDLPKNETTLEQGNLTLKSRRDNEIIARQEKLKNISKKEILENKTIAEQGQTVNKTRRCISENETYTTEATNVSKEDSINPEYGRKFQTCLTQIFITVIKPNCSSLPASSSNDYTDEDSNKFIDENSNKMKRQLPEIKSHNRTYRFNYENESMNRHVSNETSKNVTVLRARKPSEIEDSDSVENIFIQIGKRKRNVFEINLNHVARREKRNVNTIKIENMNQTKERTYDLKKDIPVFTNRRIEKRSPERFKNITIQIQRLMQNNDEIHRKIRSTPDSANVTDDLKDHIPVSANSTLKKKRSPEGDKNITIQIQRFMQNNDEIHRKIRSTPDSANVSYDLKDHIPVPANSTLKKRSPEGDKNITIQIQRLMQNNDEIHRKIRSTPDSANVSYDLKDHTPVPANSSIKKRSPDGYKNITIQIQRLMQNNDEIHRKMRSTPPDSANVNKTKSKTSREDKLQKKSTINSKILQNDDRQLLQKEPRRKRYNFATQINNTKIDTDISKTKTPISLRNVSTENNPSNKTKSIMYHHHHFQSKRETAENQTNSTLNSTIISEKDISRDDRSLRMDRTKNGTNSRKNSTLPRQGVSKQLGSRYHLYGKNGSRPHNHKTYNSRRLLAINKSDSEGPSLLLNDKDVGISTDSSIKRNVEEISPASSGSMLTSAFPRVNDKTVEKRDTNIIAFDKAKNDYYKYVPSESPGYDSNDVDVMDHSFQVVFSDIRCACAIYTDLASINKDRKPNLFVEISVEQDGVDRELLCTKSCSELARIRMEMKQEVYCSHLKADENNPKDIHLPENKPDSEIIICQVFTGESEPALHFILSWLNVVLVDVVVCLSGLSIVCMYLICFVSWKKRDASSAFTSGAFGSK